jgi:hypothetical protein
MSAVVPMSACPNCSCTRLISPVFFSRSDPAVCRNRCKPVARASLAYVVFYAYDSSAGGGFVYLPGKGGEFAELNTSHIYRGRGYEGHWFKAAKAWDDFVRSIIATATEHTAAR